MTASGPAAFVGRPSVGGSVSGPGPSPAGPPGGAGVAPHRSDGGHSEDGGPFDRRFPPGPVLGTLFLIAGEVMLFSGLLFAFWVLRLAAPAWPPLREPHLPLGVTTVNTLVLLASSGAVLEARQALRRQDRAGLARGLGAAVILGGAFLALQGYEWLRFLAAGFTATSGTYGALFYTLIGAHAVHMTAAVAWLATAAGLARGGRYPRGRPAPLHALLALRGRPLAGAVGLRVRAVTCDP